MEQLAITKCVNTCTIFIVILFAIMSFSGFSSFCFHPFVSLYPQLALVLIARVP